ncbi:Uncharacterised protein [Mycobacteroides abscessus subsp. abscessus]|nr:Uncharacterised protein [Mycobacteroides abscessus subsp. abscessus]
MTARDRFPFRPDRELKSEASRSRNTVTPNATGGCSVRAALSRNQSSAPRRSINGANFDRPRSSAAVNFSDNTLANCLARVSRS